jgi:DNA-binding LacI/PurR family transcriptional regulator
MPATLKDIAAKLNISVSTASYAINGGPRSVPAEVKQRVLDTARELGYRPNRIARSLVAGKTMTLGVVPVQITIDLAVVPYFQEAFNGVVNEAELLEYDVLLFTRAFADPDRLADVLLDGRVDGLIFFAPNIDSPVLSRIRESRFPFVVINNQIEGTEPCFSADNRQGITVAVEHLVSLGHKRIAHIHGPLEMFDAVERHHAFLEAMVGHRLEVRKEWLLDGQFTPMGGHTAACRLLSMADRPTAVVCANDEIATGVYRAAWEMGVQIPTELSVVGFDNNASAQVLLPRLTTIRQPLEEMGAASAKAIVEMLNGGKPPHQQFQTELIVRESTTRPVEVS